MKLLVRFLEWLVYPEIKYYDPKVFGIYYPEYKRIYIGECGGKGEHYFHMSRGEDWHVAHAHTTLDDPIRGAVCFYKRAYIAHNTTVLHELAHLRVTARTCSEVLAMLATGPEKDPRKFGHGEEWQEQMRLLGFIDPISAYAESDKEGNLL